MILTQALLFQVLGDPQGVAMTKGPHATTALHDPITGAVSATFAACFVAGVGWQWLEVETMAASAPATGPRGR